MRTVSRCWAQAAAGRRRSGRGRGEHALQPGDLFAEVGGLVDGGLKLGALAVDGSQGTTGGGLVPEPCS